ncbi:MAG: phosphatidate cytidylyltransferase [Actinomycetota bacterium]|nr:phosphatidate cytidylyltransferase [Actinomycetota bacterium]MDQ3644803.1 phosphatidate cytidylyltransferase [Actinomycetota bacterium]
MSAPARGGGRSATRRRDAPPRRRRSDLGARILAAIPAVLFAYIIVTQGGLVLALGLILLGVVALRELYSLMRRSRPVDLGGYLAIGAVVLLATYGEREDVLIALVAAFPAIFILALTRTSLDNLAWGIAATLLGVAWIGLPLAHAVFLRDLPHGDGLLIDVLVGTFIGDTAAYLGGRLYGRRKLAPDISPHKTVEGLLAGVVGGTIAFWAAGLYQDWLSGLDALAIGFLVAITAPLGDLFESALKRDLEVKDTGRFFGPHGGVLDRLDAAFFTVVVGYYAAVGLGYG